MTSSGVGMRDPPKSIEDERIDVATRVGVEGLVPASMSGRDDRAAVPIVIMGAGGQSGLGTARSRANKVSLNT